MSLSPLEEEDSFDAYEHAHLMEFELSVYNKNMSIGIALICNNCTTNRFITTTLEIKFVVFAINRFYLVVEDALGGQTFINDCVKSRMVKLLNLVISAKLRILTHLIPLLNNITIWSYTFHMMKSYQQLREFLPYLGSREVDELLQNAHFNREIDKLCISLADLDIVTTSLKADNLTISDVRD